MIENIYNKIMQNIDTRIICDRSTIELTDNHLQIKINNSRSGVKVEIKRKCEFCGFFIEENSFPWYVGEDKDIDKLITRIHKIRDSKIDSGPFGFSRRSTYIKRQNKIPIAKSGNFVTQANCAGVVSIGEKGKIEDDIIDPNNDPWFLININDKEPRIGAIIYNLDAWWPLRVERGWGKPSGLNVTSVLQSTGGRLLTMHDKFVIDLAVKLYNEDRND